MAEVVGVETRKPVFKDKSVSLRYALKSDDVIRNDFSDYLNRLGIVKEDLGNTVLDIGSSVDEEFAIEASHHGIKVFSVNPQLLNDDKRLERNIAHQKLSREKLKPESVVALSKALPFKDESFDTVVSLFSLPFWVQPDEWDISFREAVRVLKPGGKAYFGPLFFSNLGQIKQILKNIDGIDFRTKRVKYKRHQKDTVLTITKSPK